MIGAMIGVMILGGYVGFFSAALVVKLVSAINPPANGDTTLVPATATAQDATVMPVAAPRIGDIIKGKRTPYSAFKVGKGIWSYDPKDDHYRRFGGRDTNENVRVFYREYSPGDSSVGILEGINFDRLPDDSPNHLSRNFYYDLNGSCVYTMEDGTKVRAYYIHDQKSSESVVATATSA